MKLLKKFKKSIGAIKIRTFHPIATGIGLFLLGLVMFFVLNYFFQFFAEQMALAASQRVEDVGIAEEIYLAVQYSAEQISTEITIIIISVLLFGLIIVYIIYDILSLNLIINPLERIGDKASQIIEDRSNLGDQIKPPMFEEMRKLTETFNKMSLELQTQVHVLEYKVQKRTRELEQAKEHIEHLANHDTLTDLPNRRLFNEHISQAIRLAHRNKEKLALLMIDLNQFKMINDNYGHMMGDEVLKQIARRFQDGLRESDLVARWGGDEFSILAFNIVYKSDVERIISRIFEDFKQPIEANGHQHNIQMSIGAALYPKDGEDKQTLLHHADAALYKAKETKNTNSFCFYQEDFDLHNGSLSDWLT